MVSALIIDYKSHVLTGEFIQHAMNMLSELRVFVVVDNSADDANFQKLIELWRDENPLVSELIPTARDVGEEIRRIVLVKCKDAAIYLVQPKLNLGSARGNNLAAMVDQAYIGSDYYIFTNNDIEIHDKESISALRNVLISHEDVMCVGPVVVGLDGLNQSPHKYMGVFRRWIVPHACWFLMSALWKISPRLVDMLATDIITKKESGYVYRLIGAFVMVDAKRFITAGMYDPETFIYGDEMILAERALEKGLRIFYLRDISVTHEQGVTTGTVFNMERQLRTRFKSEMHYYKKYRAAKPWMLNLAARSLEFYVSTYIKPRMKRKQGAK